MAGYRKIAVLLLLVFAGTRELDADYRARINGQTRLRNSISSGSDYTCQVMGDGTVRCWGLNSTLQLGVDNTNTSGNFRATPVTVPGLTGVVSVAAGTQQTCALLSTGSVRCWGAGALGIISNGPQSTPVEVLAGDSTQPSTLVPLINVKAIAAGDTFTCALITDGTVRCWGANSYGELGIGNQVGQYTAVLVSGLANVVAIASGGSHSCAVISDGTARCWGTNQSGEIGDGTSLNLRLTPVPVQGLAGPVVAISAGVSHTCALLSNSKAQCWGYNRYGQLGTGSAVEDNPFPGTVVELPGTDIATAEITAISAGAEHTCALLAGGTPRCWGYNGFGQLGDGTIFDRNSADQETNLTNLVAISAGFAHTCVVLADGSAQCYGKNAAGYGDPTRVISVSGQLGNGDTTSIFSTTPVTVSGGGGSVSAAVVEAGSLHTCAVRTNGSVACWGSNSHGELGDGTTTNQTRPVAVQGLSNAVAVTAGESHTCTLHADGTVRCWGINTLGESGGSNTIDQKTPVVGGVSSAVAISAGTHHTCALLSNGTAKCWGSDANGALGDGRTINSANPVVVNGLADAVSIAAGNGFTCALLSSGTTKCWGANFHGQLGNGTTTSAVTSLTTVSVPDSGGALTPLTNIVSIAADEFHTCAVISTGTARCWGDNIYGEIGDNTTGTDRLTPVLVRDPPNTNSRGFLTNVVSIAAGATLNCARTGAGTARCWGSNATGQLGDNTTTDKLTPSTVVQVVLNKTTLITSLQPHTGLTHVTAGNVYACALQFNGSPLCWGANALGELGDGTVTGHLTPVGVPSFTLNIDPHVHLKNNRVTSLSIIAVCDPGDSLHVNVKLVQGSSTGSGVGQGECTGRLESYPVTVSAQGKDGFGAGAAQAFADGSIRTRGLTVDTQQWTRAVTIIP